MLTGKDDEESYIELVSFLKQVLKLKGIDITKQVKDNIGDSWDI